MAIHNEQIESFFAEEGLKYRLQADGTFLTGFATDSYERADGQKGIGVLVRVSEDGGSVEFVAPNLYSSLICQHREALFNTLLAIMMRARMIRYEHDPEDGEIRCSIEYPVINGTLTRLQFRRMLDCLASTIDRWDRVVRTAMRTGLVCLDTDRPRPDGGLEIGRDAGQHPGREIGKDVEARLATGPASS